MSPKSFSERSRRPRRRQEALARAKTGRGGRNAGRFCARGLFGDGGGDGFRAVRRVVKLNSDIQNRSVRELLELLGDQKGITSVLLPAILHFDPKHSWQDMSLLLHAMMVRHHVSFVLKPTEKEAGFDLGIKWSLCFIGNNYLQGKKLPWGIDCNVSTSHVYRGLLLISQVNKTCVPLLQGILQIIQQNLDAVISTIVHKVLPEDTLDEKSSSSTIWCVIVGLVVMVLFNAMFRNL
ncbi:uncharacterized protein LOC133895179 [Phragmites australis]|uniref:uncharacterized protein LOC133895179 n=1 Tax=Phragmites australis TaxID=29695 RepID=UPI002D7979CC|nr:uncharacterized protein LOC133895179 [Phragmites australis]